MKPFDKRTAQHSPINNMLNGPSHGRHTSLVFCAAFEPGHRAGGPIRSIAAMIDSSSDYIEPILITRDRDIGDSTPYPGLSGSWVGRGNAQIFYLNTRRVSDWLNLLRFLRSRHFDSIYLNSLFSPVFTLIPLALVSVRAIKAEKITLAPRGELSPGALEIKSAKKRRFISVSRPALQRLSVMFHATSDQESFDIHHHFPSSAVLTVPNQVRLTEQAPYASPTQKTTRLIFISRIVPKKNLLLLLQALGQINGPLELDIYGPLEDQRYWQQCLGLIAASPVDIVITYKGDLQHRVVPETFLHYDAFAFPTRGENFGHVIAESLASGCPVICSDTTPWTTELRGGGGSVVSSLAPVDWAHELSVWRDMSVDDRKLAKADAMAAYLRWRAEQPCVSVLDKLASGTSNDLHRRGL